jgi:hypothetical protein
MPMSADVGGAVLFCLVLFFSPPLQRQPRVGRWTSQDAGAVWPAARVRATEGPRNV